MTGLPRYIIMNYFCLQQHFKRYRSSASSINYSYIRYIQLIPACIFRNTIRFPFSHSSLFHTVWIFLSIFFNRLGAFLFRFPFFLVDSLPFIVSNSLPVAFATRIGSREFKRTGCAERQQYFPEKFELHFSRWQWERK